MKNKKYWLIESGSSSCRRMMADLENVQIHDFEWVKRSVKVDYHYNNEFSPKELVKDIIREIQREK